MEPGSYNAGRHRLPVLSVPGPRPNEPTADLEPTCRERGSGVDLFATRLDSTRLDIVSFTKMMEWSAACVEAVEVKSK